MKTKWILMLTVLAMLVTALPGAALAKAATPVKLNVYNHTGADAQITTSNAAGASSFFTVPAGWSQIELGAGKYDYRIGSQCGGESGVWNLNVTKSVDIRCLRTGGVDAFFKQKAAKAAVCDLGVYLYYQTDGTYGVNMPPNGIYFFSSAGAPAEEIDTFVEMLYYETNNDTEVSEQGDVWVDCYDGADYYLPSLGG